jgi:predicted nucleic acid-binding protein
MARKNIADAGFIIAYLDPDEGPNHEWAKEQFARHGQFFTCAAVIAEACARIAYAKQKQSRVLRMIDSGALALDFAETPHISRLIRLMDKYANRPMDLADACLVVMAEEMHDVMIYTLDTEDFSIYRRHGREIVPFTSPALR